MGDVVCFKCGQPGHPRAACPGRTPKRPDTPPDPADAVPAPKRGSMGEIAAARIAAIEHAAADPHAHAERVRQAMGWAPSCGNPDDVYTSPFRRAEHLPAIHACQLRTIAAEQVREFRSREIQL